MPNSSNGKRFILKISAMAGTSVLFYVFACRGCVCVCVCVCMCVCGGGGMVIKLRMPGTRKQCLLLWCSTQLLHTEFVLWQAGISPDTRLASHSAVVSSHA